MPTILVLSAITFNHFADFERFVLPFADTWVQEFAEFCSNIDLSSYFLNIPNNFQHLSYNSQLLLYLNYY